MNDEELEVLVAIDDPEYGPEEDIFDHHHGATAIPSGHQQGGDKTADQD